MLRVVERMALVLVVGLSIMAGPIAALAQESDYPNRPITLVVPFGSAGSVDRMARMLAEGLTEELGEQIVVENMPGASSNLGTNRVAQSEPDGYTLLITSAAIAVNQSLFEELPFNVEEDITPIAMVGSAQNILITNPETGIESVEDMIANAKENPGELSYASTGSGTSGHLTMELLKSLADLDIDHVAYSNVGQAHTDLIANVVQLQMPTIPGVLGNIESGTMIPLAVSGGERVPALEDVPTVAEAGVEGYDATTWYPLLGPADLPDEVVAKLESAVENLVQDEAFAKQMREATVEPFYKGSEELDAFIRSEAEKWANVIESAGIERK